MSSNIKELKGLLNDRGFTPEMNKAIREAKICVIDDKISDLKSLMDGLRREGFNHLVEKEKVSSINDILNNNFDLVILDLSGVAADLSKNDGIGVIHELKEHNPALPILVVTGSTTPPELTDVLSKADLIRTKPVLPADLSSDVEKLLKYRKDNFWAAYAILKELRSIQPELAEKLKWRERIKLFFFMRKLHRDIKCFNPNIVKSIVKTADIVERLGSVSLRIVEISKWVALL